MRASSLILPCLAFAGAAHAASLTEPSTVFYGRVTNQNSGGQIVHEGELVWTISGPDNQSTVLRAKLAPHDEGRYSYFLEVPHHVLATGLTPLGGTVALGTAPKAYRHMTIRLDDREVAITVPGEDHFNVATLSRAATHRLDLTVSLPVTDSDGDGMPDWWEEANGLDPDADDAGLDPDGDGISNLEEFRRGTGPGTDNRAPELLTSRLLSYAGARTGVMLRTADVDTEPGEIVHTLVTLPASGELLFRGEEILTLKAGDSFTQADVLGGRLVFSHPPGAEQTPTRFTLRIRDETAAHVPSEGEIEIVFYDPVGASAPSQWVTASLEGSRLDGVAADRQRMARDAVLGREHAYVIWDLADAQFDLALTQPADGLANTITGGTGKDVLKGGAAVDFIAGGTGDDRLTGAAGGDRFVLLGSGDGKDQITDFAPLEGDVIDVTAALAGTSPWLSDYLRLKPVAGGSELGIDANGDGSGFSDVVVTLENYALPVDALYVLVAEGRIVAGSLALPPLIRIAATDAQASESGQNPGGLTVTRLGPLDNALVVNLQVGGTATNGSDYSFLPGSVTIPAGTASVAISVLPFADGVTEGSEIVEVRVLGGSGYSVAETGGVAQVVIEPLKPQIRVEALVPVASVSDARKGVFAVSRGGDIGSSVLLRFKISGSARSGSDYEAIPAFYSLPANQSFALIEVAPRAGAQLAGGAVTVVLTIQADVSYERAEPSSAEVVIVPELHDFATWRARHFAGSGGSMAGFAVADPGQTGLVQLQRYAFGLDPASPRSTSTRLPTVTMEGGRLTLRYHEDPAAVDLEYAVEVSDALSGWAPASALQIERLPSDPLAPLTRIYRSTKPATQSDFRYLRVRVTRP